MNLPVHVLPAGGGDQFCHVTNTVLTHRRCLERHNVRHCRTCTPIEPTPQRLTIQGVHVVAAQPVQHALPQQSVKPRVEHCMVCGVQLSRASIKNRAQTCRPCYDAAVARKAMPCLQCGATTRIKGRGLCGKCYRPPGAAP